MAYDASTHQLVLTGEASSDTVNETWIWTGATWSQLSPATSPPARSGASMAYDPTMGQLVLFGGQGSGGLLRDTWTWNGTTWTQQSPSTSPSARKGASMAYDASSSQFLLFGGYDGSNYLNDTWTWNGSTWTNVGLVEPGNFTGRDFVAMAYDPASSQLLLFSGFGGTNFFSDTWSWTGSAWTQLSPTSTPGATGGASMTYDPDSSQLVFFGGNHGSDGTNPGLDSAQFSGWNGSAFVGLAGGTPGARDYAAMAYDPDSSQLILFGGDNSLGNYVNDTWTYSSSSPTSCSISSSSLTDNFAAESSLSGNCWQTGTPLLSTIASHLGSATYVAPQLAFNGSNMDMQGASSNPEFTAIQSTNAYQAPFDFETTVQALQSGDNSFVVYLVNAAGGNGFSVEGNLSSSPTGFNGVWASGYVGAGSDIDGGVFGQQILSNQPIGTTFHISMSIDTDGDIGITVNGTTITSASLGRVGNGPFYVVLGQRETDATLGGPPVLATGANEAAWSSASLTTNYCSASSFSIDFGLDYALSGVADGNLQGCWQADS
ncbi:MAG TPA: hypothetical protein VK217_09180, partial [Acidimicrobiales bacterium]|nr:hypothetical protein [Acidimicrobiales bacterium]